MSKQKSQPEAPPLEETQLVPTVPQHKPPTLALEPEAPPSEWHHNFDLTTRSGKAALINASNVADWIPSDGESITLIVTHYVVYPDLYMDQETGEVITTTACVLVGHDGKLVKFRNDWSLRRLHALITLYTPDEWRAGLMVECYAAKSRQPGRTYGSFRILDTDSPNTHTESD